MNKNPIPIIAIDGTTASGKGTIAYKLAQHFGLHYLNSGALYRITAYTALNNGIDLAHKDAIVGVAKNLQVTFDGKRVIVGDEDVWPIISTEDYGRHASTIAPHLEVREALHKLQRSMIKHPGLVGDGRDMGNSVLKDAHAKIYLDADITVRAKRRHGDELEKRSGKTLENLTEEIRARDYKDMHREHGRLYPANDALVLDTSNLNIEQVLEKCIAWCEEKGIGVH